MNIKYDLYLDDLKIGDKLDMEFETGYHDKTEIIKTRFDLFAVKHYIMIGRVKKAWLVGDDDSTLRVGKIKPKD